MYSEDTEGIFPLCSLRAHRLESETLRRAPVAHIRGEGVGIVTIPFAFDKTSDPLGVIPICIEDTDRYGRPITPGWFRAAVPIADPLRLLSRRALRDPW